MVPVLNESNTESVIDKYNYSVNADEHVSKCGNVTELSITRHYSQEFHHN